MTALPVVADDIESLEVPWALVGGLALCARAEPRPTADIDIALRVADDSEVASCLESLSHRGYSCKELIRHDETGRVSTALLERDVLGQSVRVDLFFASAGVEAEVAEGAELLQLGTNLMVPVARLGHLIAVKLLWRSSEKVDRDLRVLFSHADKQDLRDARCLLDLITERGYHRGRDLAGSFEGWLPQTS